jgi:bis(5'-nucleosyl)-tetraphosphatase (symmetrical)
LKWLRQQPLIEHNAKNNTLLCHAGIPPKWQLKQLLCQAKQVEDKLKSDDFLELLTSMYGNKPSTWSESLSPINQMRYTINALTRMRFVEKSTDALNFTHKNTPNKESRMEGLIPWYESTQPILEHAQVIFGHWAALLQTRPASHLLALDTGCVWGQRLTLWHQEKNELISQEACQHN